MQQFWGESVPKLALSFPFVMYEILAIAALHIGHLRPAQRSHYYHRATELQNSAMMGFHAIEMKVDKTNCVAVLCFSSLLSMQVVADPTPTIGLTSTAFIDYFSRCIGLMHGTRVLVVDKWWDYIRSQPELYPLYTYTDARQDVADQVPEQVTRLIDITHDSSLSDNARSAYQLAIEPLIWVFKISNVPHETHSTARWFVAWPVMLKAEFLDLLNERRPEALVVLAYYGTLLHFYRDCWVVGGTGARLVRAISAHVGSYWEPWLKWPNEMIQSS